MSVKQQVTLARYAKRRFVLSGTSVVKDHFPYCRSIGDLHRDDFGGGRITSFAQYDYLALKSDPRILAAAKQALDTIGAGAGASRLVGGELAIHRALERDLAEFLGVEDTLSLVSGYGTNVSLVSHLLTKGDLILADESSHNSIMVGTQLSRAETLTFRHNDLHHLETLLCQRRGGCGRVLVVVEGLYSMDGDIPDLPGLLELCRGHGAWLMIDEAHSIGVLGAAGRGLSEHFGIPASEIDLVVGTLSKAFATCGGFIGAKRGVIEWLRFTLPAFVYSVGLPPPSAAAARRALQILKDEPDRLTRLRDNSRYFAQAARARGLTIGSAAGAAVIPILFKDTPTAIEAANAALTAGFFAPPIVRIAAPREAPRMRFFVTARHERWQIDGVLDALAPYGTERISAHDAGRRETIEPSMKGSRDAEHGGGRVRPARNLGKAPLARIGTYLGEDGIVRVGDIHNSPAE